MTNKKIQEIIPILIMVVGLFNAMVITYFSYKTSTDFKQVHLNIKSVSLLPIFTIINVVIFIIMIVLTYQRETLENFFFEVSPTRKKCLMEQVSRKNFGKKMPCSCCQKGTVGGIPPNYAQWLGKSDSDTSGWFRPDHVQYVDSFSNAEECQQQPVKQPVYIEHL